MSLTLFSIEEAIHELMGAWQEAETPEAVAAAEQAIQAYVEMEVRKVDNIRGYLKACEHQAAAAQEEAHLQMRRAEAWIARRDRLKDSVFGIMKVFGVKKVEGSTGSLSIRGNGGVQPLTITEPEMIPDELCVYTGSIPAFIWIPLLELARKVAGKELALDIDGLRMKRTPSNEWLRLALARTCTHCDGIKVVICEHRNALEDDKICPDCDEHGMTYCYDCGGSGTASVAGARLDPRGESLICR